MTVTDVRRDPASRTLTLEAEFEASPEDIWRLWADPRRLERWWGPPTYPATVDTHDLRPGGRVEYHMTGPEGDQPRGFWEVDELEPPHRLVVRDGFSNEDGTPNTELPTGILRVTIQRLDSGKTRMSIESEFPTVEAMEQLLAMGQEEGMRQALGQIDAILAADPVREG
ncbi:MAG TPA: SRPBCC domain-containing protein [Actinomycetota bacterium]|nr:SRPBCC domain-containing protein [Actinomycetota bacterium]